jgi:glycosyltransferase involved in cell wall biosynthesis
MIVKNEEDVLARCLSSVKNLVNEIIIVDTGSSDRTKEIAKEFTDLIYDFEWIDDFSAARNFSFSKATMDYILWLDADDIILPEDAIKFDHLKTTLSPDIDIVMMHYNTAFDEKGHPTFSYYRERLSKRSKNYKWQEPVHEYLQFNGNIINADVSITHAKLKQHKSSRNLEIYEKRISSGEKLSARGTYYFARELKEHRRYEEAIQKYEEFLDSGLGWVEDNITACSDLGKCYRALCNHTKALTSLMRSFMYDTPRGEICCQIGYFFKEQNNYRLAAYWFSTVLSLEKPNNSWGFHQEDYWNYIPCIECAVCYDRLGYYDKAEAYNNMAALYKPDSPSVLYNKKYFENRKKDSSQ